MAQFLVNKLLVSLSLFVIWKSSSVNSFRYGLPAKTLHIPAHKLEEEFGERTRIIEADISKIDLSHLGRVRRSTADHTTAANLSTVTQLNDNHTQMIVHWAGLGSDVIIALSRDAGNAPLGNSNLYISRNYGKNFSNVTGNLVLPMGGNVVIDRYYNSRVLNSHYIFADIINSYIFTTTDYGVSFTPIKLDFKPKTVSIHPTKPTVVLGMDDEDARKRLYVSQDFGFTWRMMQEGVKTFNWGSEDLDGPDDIYIERIQIDGGSSIIKSKDYFVRDVQQLMLDAEDFQMIGKYMFVTKKRRLLGSTNSTLQLWVSYNRGAFVNAQFGNNLTRLDYYIADASEEQVFVCVTHNETSTHLYISDITGSKFSLSLENVVYYNPKGSHSNSWLRYFTQEPFADVTKIEALRGVYIANIQKNATFDLASQQSLITFDKGGEWVPLTAPVKDLNGQLTNCTKQNTSALKDSKCSLHLTQEFSRLYPRTRTSAIMSRRSAPGIVIGMGVTGNSLKLDPDMFISSDAGYTWHEVLEGNQFYAMGDHGGLIISVPQFRPSNVLYYSWNEGQTWQPYTFHDESIRVYGILTEPGEMTSIFTLFGSHVEQHRWLIIQIDLHSIFPYQCNKDDYKMWSFPDQKPYFGCILGKKTVYERRLSHANCFNGRDYDREIVEKNCSCTREDFECDFGFILDENMYGPTTSCKEDPDFMGDLHGPPSPCPEGTFYPYSRGYRRIPGDTCQGGDEYRYEPYMLSCPVGELEEFLLYSSKHFIRRHLFGSSLDESIIDLQMIGSSSTIYAITFDYRNNTVFWSEGTPNRIVSMSLKGGGNFTTVADKRGMTTVESLVFDWTGGNLYWINSGSSGNASIEVARKTGEFRKILINRTYLDRPRGLVLDPHLGWMYWTDWSNTNPRIMKSAMDGNVSTIQTIVNGTDNVYWPNGITIDHRDMRIYWTDARLDRISSANLDGTGIKVIVSGTYLVPHPYAIGIYKDKIYWSDWMKKAIFSADKHTGRGIITVKTNISDVMDLKILDYLSQSDQTACSRSNGGCSQLCLPKPGFMPSAKNRTCKCDDLMPKLIISITSGDEKCDCLDGEKLVNNACVATGNCSAGRYRCGNGDCIPSTWICDQDNDCPDGLDEKDCAYASCQNGSFACGNGHCIPERWRCDFDNDCGDNTDEEQCKYPKCTADKFTCANGRCINLNWTCDFDDDCRDGSDEINCNITEVCSPLEFHCTKHQPKCIAMSRQCDGIRDCTDNSDEENCNATICSSNQFRCHSDGRCIYKTWQCDGGFDCVDRSDEQGCTTTTTPRPTNYTTPVPGSCHFWQFQCNNGRCVWWSNRCDRSNDCGDNSDEFNCGYETTTVSACPADRFICNNGQCISLSYRCNGQENCYDGSDEVGCVTCVDQFMCNNTKCVSLSAICDGYNDCETGEDELHCDGHKKCGVNDFTCYNSEGCVPMTQVCDGHFDCTDHSDEAGIDCTKAKQPVTCPNEFACSDGQCLPWMYVCNMLPDCAYQEDEQGCRNFGAVMSIPQVELMYANGTAMTIKWNMLQDLYNVTYIVSHMDNNHVTVNETNCQSAYVCTLTGLKPLTTYDVTVYVVTNHTIYRLHQNQKFSTTEGVPDPPTQVAVTVDGTDFTVSWKASSFVNGLILKYMIYWTDIEDKVTSQKMVIYGTTGQIPALVNGHTYNVWVTAFTQAGESAPSTVVKQKLSDSRISQTVTSFTIKKVNISCLDLSWDKMSNQQQVKEYIINFEDSWKVEQKISTVNTFYRICDLCPTEKYTFYIKASNNHGDGPETEKSFGPTDVSYSYLPSWSKTRPQSVDVGAYQVIWVRPSTVPTTAELSYTLFYDYNSTKMEDNNYATAAFKKVIKGQNMTTITQLRACESYLLRVAVSKPGRCPPSDPIPMQTGEDDTAPPENVRLTFPSLTTVWITWNAGCYKPSLNLTYVIKVTEDKTMKQSMYRLLPTTNTTVNYHVDGLKRGANYTFTVKVNVTNARWSEPTHIESVPYGAPSEFKEVLMGSGKIRLSWNPPIVDREHVKLYELYSKSLKSVMDGSDYKLLDTVNSSMFYYDVINTELANEYYFKMRIIADNDYPGQFTEELAVLANRMEPQTDSQTDIKISKTRMIAIIVAVTGVVITLVLVLGFFIIRHRRLQRSFLAFANSHYDTRSGTTTFESNELGEDEDSPMIQGFSDDEPLVIA